MSEQNIFIPLLRHEFAFRRRQRYSRGAPVSKKWWLIYIAIFLLLLLIFTTWSAMNDAFQLQGIWYMTFALLYIIVIFGFRAVNREWHGNTAGWWLTLPYPRIKLIYAKFVAAWLKVLLLFASSFLLIVLFAAYITLIESQLNGADLMNFVMSGVGWYLLLLVFSPFAVSVSILTSTMSHTELRPFLPICFFIYYLITYFIFWAMGLNGAGLYNQFAGIGDVVLFPYPLVIFYPMFAGWIICYLLIHWSAYLLEKKLTM